MATKKKIITTTVTDGDGNDNSSEPNELDSIGSYIAEITNSADDTMVSLFKYDRGGGKPVWLRDLMKEEFSLEDIRAGWGAGTYQARATNNGKLKRAITFRIGPDREDEQVTSSTDDEGTSSVKNAFESQLQMLQLQSNQMFRIVLEMIRANGANGNKSDLAGVVGVVKDLHSLAPPSNRAQLISEIKEVLEIGEMIGGGSSAAKAADPWTALTSILSQKLLKAEDGAVVKTEIPVNPNPAAGLPTTLPTVPVHTEPPTLLQLLTDKAIRGKDPELWAHMVLEWGSDESRAALEMVGAILAAADAQTWIASLKVADGLKPWFTDFFAAIRASYEAESPVEAS